MKIFQKVLGGYFFETLCIGMSCSVHYILSGCENFERVYLFLWISNISLARQRCNRWTRRGVATGVIPSQTDLCFEFYLFNLYSEVGALAVDGWAVNLVQRWGDWAGPRPAPAPPCCTKCNIPHRRSLYQSPYCCIMVRCSALLMCSLKRYF